MDKEKKGFMDIEKNLAHKMHSNSILHMKISMIFKHDLVSAALKSKRFSLLAHISP